MDDYNKLVRAYEESGIQSTAEGMNRAICDSNSQKHRNTSCQYNGGTKRLAMNYKITALSFVQGQFLFLKLRNITTKIHKKQSIKLVYQSKYIYI